MIDAHDGIFFFSVKYYLRLNTHFPAYGPDFVSGI